MPRGLLIFVFCLPLALLMGFMLSDPLMGSNMMVISGTLFALLVPTMLLIHHRALIWVSGAFVTAFFLPGKPAIWMLFAGLSFGISVLSRPLAKLKIRPVWDPWVLFSLIFLMVAVVITASQTGGIGMRVLGSAMYGGRKYVALVASFIGFLALTMMTLQRKHAQRDLSIFTLAPITSAFSNFAYMLGPSFYFLFLLFPVEMAITQAQADYSPVIFGGIKRISGFGPASIAVCMFCLCRWGVRGILQINKPWRMIIVVVSLFTGLLSGFRSAIVVSFLVAFVQFFVEGLHRTKYLAGLITAIVGGFLFLTIFAQTLPLSAQRAVSFLPVEVDSTAAADARGSLDWRFNMWRVLIKEIPKHLWIGKGYAVDPTDLFLADESLKRGFMTDYDAFINSGDYHSGPLSVIVPFGVMGSVAVIWFFIASLRVLWRNYRHGDAEIRNINMFLISFFIARLTFFLLFFGGIESDLWHFVSIVGISLSVNGGVKGPPEKPRLEVEKRPRRSREAELIPV